MPTHTITRTFAAGGITEHPSEAEPLYGEHEGVTLEAGDGTPTNVWTGNIRRWKYVWNSPDPAVVERWRARYAARSTFSHTDPLGLTKTAVIPVGGLTWKAVFEPNSAGVMETTYQMTVEVRNTVA